ncbi:MAG: hypothetical protein HKN35_13035 [Woeseia sp.]|nr:hypothetical protein [Woeseia sp.]NNL54551.1 hypothetical protein [Woeseia sp.]
MPAMTEERQIELKNVLQLLLERPGLESWARVCMSLLSLTEGIERFMDDEDEFPHRELKQRLRRALSADDPPAALLDIASLQVFEYRVMSEDDRTLWHPLEESLQQFAERHAEKIRVWRAFSAYPNREVIESWLIARVSDTGVLEMSEC